MNLAELDNIRQELPGQVIFARVWGSHGHNCALPESDVDYMAVYVNPTSEILSLSPPPDTHVASDPDIQAYGVGKFCRLLMKGNPTMIEALFTDKGCIQQREWRALVRERQSFITARALKQYLGYVEGQLRKHAKGHNLHTSGGRYNTKWAYHVMRLLGDAERIATGRPPQVWKEGSERAQLMRIRRGAYGPSTVRGMALEKIESIELLKPWPIPQEPNEAILNEWLLDIRREEF